MNRETILTVPERMAAFLNGAGSDLKTRLSWPRGGHAFVTSDPPGRKLGSGGGTVHALWRAWQESGESDLGTWLKSSQKLILHAGGESRRLPAYAAIGKAFIPLPQLTGLPAQRLDQMLFDFQIPPYSELLGESGAVALVTSGDVWLDFDPMAVPAVRSDIAAIGMRVSADVARHFGVFFIRPRTHAACREEPIAFVLQKPKVEEIHAHCQEFDFFVDTGMWLLSQRAIEHLFAACGWDGSRFATADDLPSVLDLYTDIGAAMARGDNGLSASVIPMDNAHFHHLGSNRQLFQSLYDIQSKYHGSQRRFFIATADGTCIGDSHRPVWADSVLSPVETGGANIVTALPVGSRILRIPENLCVDAIPFEGGRHCLRVYHLDDTGRGRVLFGQDAGRWMSERGLPEDPGETFDLKIYPVLRPEELNQEWLDWFVSPKAMPAVEFVSAREIPGRIDLSAYFAQRSEGYRRQITSLFENATQTSPGAFFDLDFKALADFVTAHAPELAVWLGKHHREISQNLFKVEHRARFTRFLSRIGHEADPFGMLREAILQRHEPAGQPPVLQLKEDQIVWARSPLRLDLAGGWTDTPPFCFERGGSVLNLAVMLNGQCPVQVFVRPTRGRSFRFQSIDLGISETVSSYEELATFRSPDSSFSLAKAALALAGFHPEFQRGPGFASLESQLNKLGAGLELTLLCAAPKGSGLGTSSVLAATLLGALNRTCALGWDTIELYQQVLAMEQLLTTGGGWQDQAGALFPGIKLIETEPGLNQVPSVRFLPDALFGAPNKRWLLYYTGLTRLAKNILAEIVTDMFLGRQETRMILESIRANARRVYDAIQTGNEAAASRGVGLSWRLNRMLDAGTCTPEIEAILSRCGSELVSAKLLGAGGGGYMLICARDEAAATRIRQKLETDPPNSRARFVDFTVADRGLEVTVS